VQSARLEQLEQENVGLRSSEQLAARRLEGLQQNLLRALGADEDDEDDADLLALSSDDDPEADADADEPVSAVSRSKPAALRNGHAPPLDARNLSPGPSTPFGGPLSSG